MQEIWYIMPYEDVDRYVQVKILEKTFAGKMLLSGSVALNRG